MSFTLQYYRSANSLPQNWNSVTGHSNIMLSVEYFRALETSLPENMQCLFVGFFKGEQLIGGALIQYLDFMKHEAFRKNEAWFSLKDVLVRKFSRDVMILGNNMMTGQNGFYFDLSEITIDEILELLDRTVRTLQKEVRKTSLVICKDYRPYFSGLFRQKHPDYFQFSVQPTMIMNLRESWKSFDDYLADLSTKYRTRAKTARKKLAGIEKHELDAGEIQKYRKEMKALYRHVAENAVFNTFFLEENHFARMKENLKDHFRVFGYFSGDRLVGFYTLIINHTDIDTYFLGYDRESQKEKQIYLNMLLDMVEFSVRHQYPRIIFGRTALEIKSTIGAEPVEISGFIRHRYFLVNRFMKPFFSSVSPKAAWIQRKPFK